MSRFMASSSSLAVKRLSAWLHDTPLSDYSTRCNDDAFGPVSTCRFFDFTLTFQNVIVLIASTTFIALAVLQNAALVRRPFVKGSSAGGAAIHHPWLSLFVHQSPLDKAGAVRALLATLHMLLSAATLGLMVSDTTLQAIMSARTAVPSMALNFVAGVLLVPTTILCRRKLPNGSPILPLYLFVTVLTDACRLRTLGGVTAIANTPFFRVSIADAVVKGLALFAENTNGLASINAAPDARASFLSRMLFWWLKEVLWTGFRRPLDMVNLGSSLGAEYDSEMLGRTLQQTWNTTLRRHVNKAIAKHSKNVDVGDAIELDDVGAGANRSSSAGVPRQAVEEAASQSRTLLLKSCFLAFPQAVLAPVIPALIRVGVQLCLPFLVSRTLAFAESQQEPATAQPSAYGWGLVGAYAMVYLIEAFSSGQFYWLADKTQILLRGALIDVIYRKSLRLHLSTASEVGGGSISNLMSVDLERVCRAIVPLHTIWSGLLQVGLSAYLLYLQLGLSFFATLISIALCLTLPPICARGIGPRQSAWSGATDKRVNLVSSAVNNAKGVKYMAYERFIADKLHEARAVEVQLGWRYFRRLLVISSITNLVKEFTALTTFTTLLLVDHFTGSQRFNVSNVVTSLTLLNLLEVPLLQIGQQYGAVVAALVSLRRIQSFLGKRERPLVGMGGRDAEPSVDHSGNGIRAKSSADLSLKDSAVAASFQSASIGWSPTGKPVLVNVTLDIPANALTMICGAIGSGKSTLLQAVLGEVDVQSGSLRLPLLREPVAYVAQDGWLQENATIRDNITLQTPFDAELYQMVIYATALHIDLKQLDKHDDTPAKSLSGGQRQRLALARALYSQVDTYVMDDFTSALDAETAAHVWNALMGPAGLLRNKTVVFATNALQFLGSASLIVRLQNGKVVEQGGPQELSAAARDAISRASIDETERARADAARHAAKTTESADRKDAQHEEVEHGKIRWSIYKQWCLAAGVLTCVFLFVGGSALLTAAKTGWVVYLQYFARAQQTVQGVLHKWDWLGGLAALVLSTAVLFVSFFFPQCWVCVVKVGSKLHRAEVQGVWNAGLSFFEANAPGVIINRFSQDIFVMDWELTLALTNFLGCGFELVAQMLLMVIPVPYLLIVVVIVGFAYVGIQRLYAPVSRQLRRLEMATKSPLYSQFAETSQPSGLATIRALRRQQTFIDVNTGRLDRSQQPYFYLQAVRRWLLTWLNLLSLIVNVSLVAIIVILKNTKQISLLGAGLVNATQLALMLNLTLIAYTELEITSIALERILGFAALEPEESGAVRNSVAPGDVAGKLELRNLSVTYPEAPRPALRDVSLVARPGERIGICGRSGSGKSTLLLAIFRMLEPTEGKVLLDDQDIQAVSAFSLRNSLTIVPQNALVLAASVRENLDPLREHEDSALWQALETCRLIDVIRAFPNGLDTELDAKFNLSAGQRQLFNLTRALLRRRKLLVLDEATSSMDHDTDAAIQDVLRTQFRDTTILTVAHRIATVRDYDRIMVLSNGQVVELDTPDNLMRTDGSVFRSLALEQGVQ